MDVVLKESTLDMIRKATGKDLDFLKKDVHISSLILKENIERGYVYIIETKDGTSIGWLRYNLFWDNTPFLNMLYVLEEYRDKGYGSLALTYWEEEMKKQGFKEFMTSTLVHESAIHFYLKHGYEAVGGFHPSLSEYEIILKKTI